jgi:hypothetical protein
METPQEFTFKHFNGKQTYQILSNGKKVVIWFVHTSGTVGREVFYPPKNLNINQQK